MVNCVMVNISSLFIVGHYYHLHSCPYALPEFNAFSLPYRMLNKKRTASATALIRISRPSCSARVGLHRSPILHMKKSIFSITKYMVNYSIYTEGFTLPTLVAKTIISLKH